MKMHWIAPILMSASLLTSVEAGAVARVRDGELKNFQPGEYVLIKGGFEMCGVGTFALNEGETALELGSRHSLRVVADTEVEPCLDESIKDCIEKNETKVEVNGGTTTLTEIHTITHGQVEVEKNIETATITKWLIKYDSNSKGPATDTYSCTWKYKKAPKAKTKPRKS